MNFLEFKDFIYAYSKEKDIYDIYIYYTKSQGQSMSCLKGKIKSYALNLSDICNVTLTINGKTTSVYTNCLSEKEAKRIIDSAIDTCEFLEHSPQFMSFDDCKVSIKEDIKLSTYNEISDIILNAEYEALNYSKKISSVSTCSFKESITEVFISNSNGLDKSRVFFNKFLYIGSTSNIDNRTYNSFDYSWGKNLKDINYKKTARKSSSNTISYINPMVIPSKAYNVILRNNVFCDLLQTFSSVFSAENCHKGTSLLYNKENEKIASNLINIIDTGISTNSKFRYDFDDDGTNTRYKPIIENGILLTLLYNIEWANKLNRISTGNGFKPSISSSPKISPCIFYLEKGKSTKKTLLNAHNNIVLITDILGLHSGANTNTGNFSLEATGFYVENGKILHPIENFTISDNFYDILKKVELVGNDMYFDLPTTNSQYGSPSILVNNVAIANA